MEFFTLLKHNARKALSHQWGTAIAIVLLSTAVGLLFSLFEMICTIALDIPGFVDLLNTPEIYLDDTIADPTAAFFVVSVTLIMYYLITTPLKLGEKSWYYSAAVEKQEGISSIFEYFGSINLMAKAILLKLYIAVRVWLVSLLLMIPGVTCLFLVPMMWKNSASPSEKMIIIGVYGCGLVMILLAFLFIEIFKKRYFLAPYLVITTPDIKIGKAIRLSVAATKGRLTSLFMFELSFIGWYLFSILVLPVLYVQPYVGVAKALYARYLIEGGGISLQPLSNNDGNL